MFAHLSQSHKFRSCLPGRGPDGDQKESFVIKARLNRHEETTGNPKRRTVGGNDVRRAISLPSALAWAGPTPANPDGSPVVAANRGRICPVLGVLGQTALMD
jgi:hypothetical protein